MNYLLKPSGIFYYLRVIVEILPYFGGSFNDTGVGTVYNLFQDGIGIIEGVDIINLDIGVEKPERFFNRHCSAVVSGKDRYIE